MKVYDAQGKPKTGVEARYASIYVNDGSTAQGSISTTPAKVTGFAANGPSNDATPDNTNDQITINTTGTYSISFSISFSGTVSTEFTFKLRNNAVETTAGCIRTLGTGGDSGSAGFVTLLTLSASDVLTVYVEANGAAKSITPEDMHLTAQEISAINTSGPSGGSDADAIHDNVAGEIAAVTEKASPVGSDVLLIEDSAAANAKKRVQITNLPAGGETNSLETTCTGILADEVPVGSGADVATYTGTTGSGNVVRATSPTLVTPALGTPSSGNLSSCTAYEGTAVASTGEVGANKYLREDGDGTCSWQTVSGAGTNVQVDTGGNLAAADFQDGGDINFAEAAGVVTATVKADTITYDKMQDTTQSDIFLGRDTVGAGTVEEITKAAALLILNVADGADVTSVNETSHADVVQDGDFATNGYMQRTGAGAYGVQATPIPTTDTAAKCTDATADNTAANQTSHADVVQDGDFSADGYLQRSGGSGSYAVQATPIPTTDTAAKCTDATADNTAANETSHTGVLTTTSSDTVTNKDLTDQTNKLHWSKGITIETPANGDRLSFYMNERAVTITGISFASTGGTSVLFNVEYAATIASGTVIHTDTCATSTPEWDVTPSGTTAVPTNQILAIEITTVTGVVDQFHVTVEGDHT